MPGLRWWVLLFVVVLVAGCAKPKPKVGTVTGKVTLDGKTPLASGEIYFEIEGSGKTPAFGPITNGEFNVEVPVGKNKVSIFSYKEGKAGKGPGEGTPTKENILPAKYNTESTDIREVTEAGPNNFEIKVTSK